MSPRAPLLLILAAGLWAPQSGAAEWRDPFTDGSGRQGPMLVAVPGGEVVLGEPGQTVTLTPFAMARDTVSTDEFVIFLNETGTVDADGVPYLIELDIADPDVIATDDNVIARPGRGDLPITGISWQGALAYARWLSDHTGHHYALPSEAQWEYAARAGSRTPYPWGEDFDPAQANCTGTEPPPRLPTTRLPLNRFGLRGMLGNVWQWTADCWNAPWPPPASGPNPTYFRADCPNPMVRGGGAASPAQQCRPGFRIAYWWRGSPDHLGFRVVRLD